VEVSIVLDQLALWLAVNPINRSRGIIIYGSGARRLVFVRPRRVSINRGKPEPLSDQLSETRQRVARLGAAWRNFTRRGVATKQLSLSWRVEIADAFPELRDDHFQRRLNFVEISGDRQLRVLEYGPNPYRRFEKTTQFSHRYSAAEACFLDIRKRNTNWTDRGRLSDDELRSNGNYVLENSSPALRGKWP